MTLLTGCVSTPAPPATQPAIVVSQDGIAIDLDPQSCVCHLSQVDLALLQLPGVARLDWDADIFRVTMHFLDDRRPTDKEIRDAMETTDVRLKAIHRP